MRSAARSISLAVAALVGLVLLWGFFSENGLAIPTHVRHLQIPLLHSSPKYNGDSSSSIGNGGSSSSSSSSSISTVSQDSKQELDDDDTAIPSSYSTVDTLWYQWSQIIYDNRPHLSKIELTSDAPNNGVHGADPNPRAPYHDLVKNPATDMAAMESAHTGLSEELNKLARTTSPYKGHGVVLVGGAEYYGPAITTISMLRKLGCELQVEVFVRNRSEYEPYVCEEFFPKIGAKCMVITDFLDRGAHVFEAGHYQLKVLALLFSSFRHVLFLDSDSMPLIDPYAKMMQVEPYKSTGMVVWPDFWAATESPVFYKIAGLEGFPAGLPKTSSESGQMLMDKGTHLQALLLATYYNIYGPDLYYRLLSQGAMGEGDKETFLAAAVVMNSTYYRVKHPVEAVMNDDGPKSKGRAMLQYHAGDEVSTSKAADKPVRPAFLHANLPKMNAGHLVDEGDLFSEVNTTQRWRLLGDKDKQIRMFGYDIEATIFEIMMKSGCDLADKIKDWQKREKLCQRITEHYEQLFAGHGEEKEVVGNNVAAALKGATDDGEDDDEDLLLGARARVMMI
ncbi:glycosyltransferase family 71 protein [Myriangium duriaei CBS 260.36]|uniref:Glycosyltransferase family 71 protein n=1 Tax=Myriangium duriaei CBS 260.36 TaxID=1168546 RepID=A0A9P4J5F5_9PEZI|nr:glycosyltransferase family 71 protein [Myriangium duriaei CBS 260.36]